MTNVFDVAFKKIGLYLSANFGPFPSKVAAF
ncbi:hypothetical protein SSU05_0331 [Streptococcus suis 05ZYH33]|nr:hypothetical protein SSU05_0331 [Streptococcus suis 05ZYH33]